MSAEALVLASGSRIRREMLERAGVRLDVVPALIDEGSVKASFRQEGHSAQDVAKALADAKASTVSLKPDCAARLVLGADQMLSCEGRWLSKPTSRTEAAETLLALSGRVHELHVAATVCRDGARLWGHTETAQLTMRPLSAHFIDSYLDEIGDGAFESVGAYQLEGHGAQLFSKVRGDFFTVLGLPLLAVLGCLREQDMLRS